MDYDPQSFAPVNITRHFPLPAGAVFDAWTNPTLMARWIFTTRGSEIRKIEIDRRVGGAFSIVEWTGRESVRHFGTFQKVDRPHILSFTLEVPQRFVGVTHCIVGIASTPDGCVMSFQQGGVAKEVAEPNWRAMFRTLAEVLAEDHFTLAFKDQKWAGSNFWIAR
jgi:uncharacterized protein YndB with AHSA1/START domain